MNQKGFRLDLFIYVQDRAQAGAVHAVHLSSRSRSWARIAMRKRPLLAKFAEIPDANAGGESVKAPSEAVMG